VRLLLIAIVAVCAAACGTPSQVRFETDGLHYESGGIGIRFRVPKYAAFINGKWRITNWTMTRRGDLERKYGEPYEGSLFIDLDGDDRAEQCPGYFTDLEMRNSETGGEIWVLMREQPKYRAQMKLDVLVDEYAESLSFEGFASTGSFDVWNNEAKSNGEAKAYGARVVSREFMMFGPYEAVMATIEMANLAQVKLDPSTRSGYVRVLFARVPGFQTSMMTDTGWFPHSDVGLLVVGYHEAPAYFEKGLPDFEAFLKQFTVNGKPVTVECAELSAAPAPQPPAPQPPAPTVAPMSTPSTESIPSTPSTGAP
jgi:hypothetical protein